MTESSNIDERVRRHVALAVGGCSYERVDEVDQFTEGELHRVFKVTYADESGARISVVVRVGVADEARDCARAEREARVLALVQGRGAPRLLDFRCSSQWLDAPTMCISHIPGGTKPIGALAHSDVETLGRVVAGVHLADVGPLDGLLGDARPLSAYIATQLEQSVTSRLPAAMEGLPADLAERIDGAHRLVTERIDAALVSATQAWEGSSLVLIHGDVSEGNVIWSPWPVLIDWEYARLGDPAEEVAYTFVQNDLDASRRDAFLRGYRAEVGDEVFEPTEARIRTWGPLALLGSVMWWIERSFWRTAADESGRTDRSTPRPAAHYLRNATDRLDRFERWWRR